MRAILYKRPNGDTEDIDIANIYEEDKNYLNENDIIVSLEDIGSDYAIYGDTGLRDSEGEPIEITVLSRGRSCEDTIEDLCNLIRGVLDG